MAVEPHRHRKRKRAWFLRSFPALADGRRIYDLVEEKGVTVCTCGFHSSRIIDRTKKAFRDSLTSRHCRDKEYHDAEACLVAHHPLGNNIWAPVTSSEPAFLPLSCSLLFFKPHSAVDRIRKTARCRRRARHSRASIGSSQRRVLHPLHAPHPRHPATTYARVR